MPDQEMNVRAAEGDVPLYRTVTGNSSLLLLSVHEGNYIPPSLHDTRGHPLGVANTADLDRHIAIDHGIREVTRLIAAATQAYVFKVTHSRLVADVNRFPDEADCVAPVADGTDIPMNKSLGQAARETRLATYFSPVIDHLKQFVGQVAAQNGAEPFVICMHSFARQLSEEPQPKSQDVCIFSYPEFGSLANVEVFVSVLRSQRPELEVGYNQPFSARTPGLSIPPGDKRMASPPSFFGVIKRHNVQNHFAMEICQDLIADEAGQRRMADIIATALRSTFDFSGPAPKRRDRAGPVIERSELADLPSS